MHKLPPGHPKLVTRRQFVGRGLLQATSSILLPSILDLGLRADRLYGATPECVMGGVSNVDLPFIVFDLVGGASMPGNFVVGSPTTVSTFANPFPLLGSYTRFGIPRNVPINSSQMANTFGLPMWTGTYEQLKATPASTIEPLSPMYVGLMNATSAATQLRTAMGSIVCIARDDSQLNPLNPLHIFWKAGMKGKYLHGAGTNNGLSGGYSRASLADAQFKPAPVTNLASLMNVLGMGATLSSMSATKKDRLRRLIQSLGVSQAEQLRQSAYGEEFKAIVDCASLQNAEYVSTPAGVDCRLDANVRSIFNLTTTSDPKGKNMAVPAIAYNVLNGNIGAATIEIPDADYHASDPWDKAKAVEINIGETIGRVLELAYRMQKRLFFAIITDGGNASPEDNRDWTGDDGTKCLAIVGLIDPFAATKPVLNRYQVGGYINQVRVDGSTVQKPATSYLTSDPDLVAKAIALNYFNAADMRGRFRDVVSMSAFRSEEEENSIITNPLG